MQKRVFCFLLILFLSLVSGCLPNTVTQRNDLEEMKRRLAVVEKATVSSQPKQQFSKQIEGQTTLLADLRAEVDGLRIELQRVSGQYEEAEHQREQLHDLLTMMRSELELKVSHLEGQLAVQSAQRLPLKPGGESTSGGEEVGANDQYEAALILIQKENKFAEGRKELQQFLRDHPKHELAVNAIYWIGEAYYGEKQYEKAILQFQDVIQKYAKHGKASAAMFKQGLAFGALGDKGMEKTLLQKVVSEYPKSAEAKKAAELLKK